MNKMSPARAIGATTPAPEAVVHQEIDDEGQQEQGHRDQHHASGPERPDGPAYGPGEIKRDQPEEPASLPAFSGAYLASLLQDIIDLFFVPLGHACTPVSRG